MDLEALTLRNLSNFIKFEGHEAMLSKLLDDLMPHTSLMMHSCDQMKAWIKTIVCDKRVDYKSSLVHKDCQQVFYLYIL